MKTVKITTAYVPYAPGDICTVEDEVADAIVAAECGEIVKGKAKTEEKSIDEAPVDKQVKGAEVKK